MTAQVCDTFTAFTMAAPAEHLAWSECDDEPFCAEYVDESYDDENESSSRWKWALVIAAWAAAAAAFAVVIGMAFVAFTPQQPSAPQRSSVSSVPPPDGFIGNLWSWDGEPAQNT
jgi:hypothetical protein